MSQKKSDALVVSGFCAPKSIHQLLREAARGVQNARGGRCSVSGLIVELVKHHEIDLQRMAAGKIAGMQSGPTPAKVKAK